MYALNYYQLLLHPSTSISSSSRVGAPCQSTRSCCCCCCSFQYYYKYRRICNRFQYYLSPIFSRIRLGGETNYGSPNQLNYYIIMGILYSITNPHIYKGRERGIGLIIIAPSLMQLESSNVTWPYGRAGWLAGWLLPFNLVPYGTLPRLIQFLVCCLPACRAVVKSPN